MSFLHRLKLRFSPPKRVDPDFGELFKVDQKVVHGFDSSGDIRTAMLRGDVDAMWGSIGSALS